MTMLQTADMSALDGLVSSLRTPVFLAGVDESPRPCLTLHTTVPGARRRLRKETRWALAEAGIKARCKVREHGVKRLAKDASLEQLIGRFRHDAIVFDPTGGVGRAEAVTRCAARIRDALGDGLAGIYLEPWERTLYVVLHREAVVRDGAVAFDRVDAIESALAEAVGRGLGGRGETFALKVRVGSKPPRAPVVPVDAASVPAGGDCPQVLDKLRTGSIAATVAAFFGLGVAGTAIAEGPAVSQPNARIAVGGGVTDGDGTVAVEGSATSPIGESYGVQIDGVAGGTGGDARWGIAGHLFTRDPDKGLLGVEASFTGRDDHDPNFMGRLGVEGEYYAGRISALGYGGYQYGDVDDGGFLRGDVLWYGTDDFMLGGGAEVASGAWVGRFGAEYQPGLSAFPGLSFFADGAVGEDDWERFFVGVRVYFGGEVKSLIRRHREDDPKCHVCGEYHDDDDGDHDDGFESEVCWVAREVYGAGNPEWRIFRIWLLNQAPDWFRHLYIRRGERFATWISDKTLLKKLIRIWMDTRLTRAV